MTNEKLNELHERFAGSDESRNGKLLSKIIMIPLGALLSSATVVGSIAPFGAAFIAGVPRGYVFFAAIGAVIGYLFGAGFDDLLRCAATALAVAGIRWALAELRSVSQSPAFAPLAALSAVVLTGVTVSLSNGSALSYDVLPYIAEGLLAAAAAFFLSGAFKTLENKCLILDKNSVCCLCVSALLVLLPLCSFEILGFAPFCVLALAIVPVAAQRAGLAGGSVAGAAVGTVLALSGSQLEIAGVLSIAGLLCALFMRLGVPVGTAVFGCCCALGSLATGRVDPFFIAESLISAVLYAAVPKIWIERAFNYLSQHLPLARSERRAAVIECDAGAADRSERLLRAAEGLESVCDTVCEVSQRLDRIEEPEIETVYRRATEKVCQGCAISKHCWGEGREDWQKALSSLNDRLCADGCISDRTVCDSIKSRCARWGELMQEINFCYAQFAAKQSARRRVAQVRSVVSEQLGGVSDFLSDLAKPIPCDEEMRSRLREAMLEYGYNCAEISCSYDRDGGFSAFAHVTGRSRGALSRSELARALGEDLGIELLPATLESLPGGGFNIALRSRPLYRVAFYAAQRSKKNAALCGDAYEAICSDGAAIFILSDGMGSGGRAAVDGAMACGLTSRLLEAGFAVPAALRIVNSALLTKSDDESLSTIDCLRISLYSCEAQFCKAGAARSYIIHKGVLRETDLPSLPLGIMRKTDCAFCTEQLSVNDTVIMTSDGVDPELLDSYVDTLREFDPSQGRALCENLCAAADCGEDDVTVLVMTVLEAEEDCIMNEPAPIDLGEAS